MSKERIKILLDTDIGTDIDDAVCLAYLLSHPACDLLGITTVTGESEKRAKLASAVCQAAGKDIPIYPGAEQPLLIPQKQNHVPQAEVLPRWAHQTSFPRGEAIGFLQSTIRSHPHEITLITIAPLTNIALLFSIDPELPGLLKALVMMCGRFLEPGPAGYGPLEWNAVGDHHASSIVYRAQVGVHRSIGLDVTSKVVMSAKMFRRTFCHLPVFAPILDMAEVWFRDWDGTTFHDPLAAATVFQDGLCTFARGTVEVDLGHEESLGLTRWRESPGGPHEIAMEVDAPRFFDHYLSIVDPGRRA